MEGEVRSCSGHNSSCWLPPCSLHQCSWNGEARAGLLGLWVLTLPPALPITCLPLPLPQLHYQHQVVQSLHSLWCQYLTLPLKAEEARPSEVEYLSPKAQAATPQPAYVNPEPSAPSKSQGSESQLFQQESEAPKDSQDAFGSQKPGAGAQGPLRKSIMEEILVEESPDLGSAKSPWEPDGLPSPEWNLCLEDFRKVLP